MNESNLTVPRAIEPVIRRIDLMEVQLGEQLDIAAASAFRSTTRRWPSLPVLTFLTALSATMLTLLAVFAAR
jgi:hypothetical protein